MKKRVAYYHAISNCKIKISLQQSTTGENGHRDSRRKAKEASKNAWKHLQIMRVLIWSFSLIIIVLSLLWIWAFSFALKKEDDDMLTDWIGTVLTSVCLWVLVTRPIQIIIQSAMKYFKEKKLGDPKIKIRRIAL